MKLGWLVASRVIVLPRTYRHCICDPLHVHVAGFFEGLVDPFEMRKVNSA